MSASPQPADAQQDGQVEGGSQVGHSRLLSSGSKDADVKARPAPLEPNRDPRLLLSGGGESPTVPAVAFVAPVSRSSSTSSHGRPRNLVTSIGNGLRALSPRRWASYRSMKSGSTTTQGQVRESLQSHLVESATTTMYSDSPALKTKFSSNIRAPSPIQELNSPLTPTWCCIAYFPKPSHREEDRSFLTVSPGPNATFNVPYRRGIDDPTGAATRLPAISQRRPTLHNRTTHPATHLSQAHHHRSLERERERAQSHGRWESERHRMHHPYQHNPKQDAHSRSEHAIAPSASTSARHREERPPVIDPELLHPYSTSTAPSHAISRPRPLPRIPSAPHMRRKVSFPHQDDAREGQGSRSSTGEKEPDRAQPSNFRATQGGAYLYVGPDRERGRERDKEAGQSKRFLDMDDHARRAAAALENMDDPEAARKIGYDDDWRQADWMKGLHPYAAAGSWSSLTRVVSGEEG
ncbi:hypothetical protein PUNSTDRAFT_146752 [Punctularia strigosozonata HHB-11173 SS5]|uniref:Uncharacterized protein n=1 Tax=Punctularia strigosozonata (strain HHB-11173) TaxID=741275 RepID=R7S2B7_PUNST|nr:uncharacterized protein PUNSTDRAFT_146752 [Punctularia strigosozonata HHB-11173 SS5]EIN03999.1 hypothetical protein PUNSTDRAFT_146752 [Punctularia strigosozonata HHB-11173 SS5]